MLQLENIGNVEILRVPLGNNRFVVVSKFNGEVQVHIRQYDANEKTGFLYPTKLGVCLPPRRFAELYSGIDSCIRHVKYLRDGEPVEYKKHLGGGIYLTVMSGFGCVNIRKYWVPDGSSDGSMSPVPTKLGLVLRLSEWDLLVESLEGVRNSHPDLTSAVPCNEGLDHLNQMGYFTCSECNPFTYMQYLGERF